MKRLVLAALAALMLALAAVSAQAAPDPGDASGFVLVSDAVPDAILAAARSKRYPLSRIRRLCLCACLGVRRGMNEGLPPFARVLAADEKGREILRERSAKGALPILTRPGAVRELSKDCEALFSLGAYAHDFYVLGYPSQEERRPGADWRTGPRIIGE